MLASLQPDLQPALDPNQGPDQQTAQQPGLQPRPDQTTPPEAPAKPATTTDVTVTGRDGLPLRPEPKRILDILPNYRTVSAGVTAPPASARLNLHIATEQALDYSAFALIGINALVAEARDSHPSLGKGIGGYGNYLWRVTLDHTDRAYQSGFLFPTLYHEDPRYYAMEKGNPFRRVAYAASRVLITRTYSGRETFNFAGISARLGSEAVSRTYYPNPNFSIGNFATRFGYSCARDAAFTVFREFYPDIAAHFHHHPRPEQ